MTSEKLQDVWQHRDYPVLRAICERIDVGEAASATGIEEATGLSAEDVARAVAALRRQGFVTRIDLEDYDTPAAVLDVSGDAYRVVGLHPDSSRDLAQVLIERLLEAADEAPNEADRSKLRKAAGLLGDVTKNVTAGVVSGLITSGITG